MKGDESGTMKALAKIAAISRPTRQAQFGHASAHEAIMTALRHGMNTTTSSRHTRKIASL